MIHEWKSITAACNTWKLSDVRFELGKRFTRSANATFKARSALVNALLWVKPRVSGGWDEGGKGEKEKNREGKERKQTHRHGETAIHVLGGIIERINREYLIRNG